MLDALEDFGVCDLAVLDVIEVQRIPAHRQRPAMARRQLVGHRDLVVRQDVARVDAEALVGERFDLLKERHDVRGAVIVARQGVVTGILPERILGKAGGNAVPVAGAAGGIEPLDELRVGMIGDK